MSSQASSTHCDICPEFSKARFRCQDCRQYLCEVCLTYHQKFNGTCYHKICPILCSQTSENGTECQIHKRKLEYHCSDDGLNCCSDCKENCHNKCKDVRHFSSFLQSKEEMTQKCNQILDEIQKKKKEAAQCNRLLKKNTDNWLKRIHSQLEKMKTAMVDLDDKVKQKEANLQVLVNRRQTETDKLLQTYSDTIQDLGCKITKLKTASMMDSEIEVVKAIQDLEVAIRRHEKVLDKDPCEGHTIAFLKEEHKFEAEHYVTKTLEEMMETAESINNIYIEIQRNSLKNGAATAGDDKTAVTRRHSSCECSGKTRTRKNRTLSLQNDTTAAKGDEKSVKTCERSAKPYKPSRNRTLSEREKVEHYQSLVQVKEADSVPEIQVESMEEIDIKMPDDENTCAITGIAELLSGHIIMADFNNFKLKLINENNQLIDSKNTDKEPRDIAVIDETNIMVSIPKAQCILFVEIYHDNQTNTYKMKLGKTYNVEGKCCGIAYHDNKIYTATQMPTQILILNMSGEKLYSISGENRFERPTYTIVDPDGSLIYMSDPNHKYVYGLTKNGKILFKYKVDGPHGIAATGKGELLVADFDTSSIHLVSRLGHKMATLTPENCHCPQKVFYNNQRSMLLVTMWNADLLFKFKIKL